MNCTPVGMHPHTGVSLIGEELIGRFASVVDLVYNPWQTELLRLAADAGKKAVNGLYMLVAQAVRVRGDLAGSGDKSCDHTGYIQ